MTTACTSQEGPALRCTRTDSYGEVKRISMPHIRSRHRITRLFAWVEGHILKAPEPAGSTGRVPRQSRRTRRRLLCACTGFAGILPPCLSPNSSRMRRSFMKFLLNSSIPSKRMLFPRNMRSTGMNGLYHRGHRTSSETGLQDIKRLRRSVPHSRRRASSPATTMSRGSPPTPKFLRTRSCGSHTMT